MWNQWSAGPPPIPPPSTTCNPQPPLIGPVQPTEVVAAANVATPPVVAGASTVQPVYTAPSGAPSYTPAQYAAMTPEQQYAVQQHWQQWQAYEQQYAQWHAQYGEQYKREMAAIHSGPPPTVAQYGSISASNAYAYPPPAVSNPYQPPPAPVNAPPPPPPDDKTNSTGIKALPQIYEQPPPPPPPPQQDETTPNKSGVEAQTQDCQPEQKQSSQFSQNEENNWSQPPPPSSQNQGNRWNGPPTMFNQQERQQSNQFGQQNRQQQNQFGQQNRNQQNQFGQQDTQQNQFGQQDRQQQNQFGQQDRQQQNQFGQQNRQQQNQFGQQQDRQQQNQFGQQDRQQQNQFGQQDRQQQNQFGQQERNHQNQFNQQYNNQRGRQNQGRERQGIRQNNEDLSRNNNRFSNKFDNNTQQHFDGYDDRNNRQQQQWQPSDGPRQRNNENFSNNRFDNSYNNFNNMGQQNNQQGTGWNSSQKDNSFGVPEQQTQQQPQNFKSQSNAKPMNSSGDEKAFDEQFRLWEEQFENWKKENANHPDRAMYMKYEREFEKTRVRLLERREQMRRRKMLEMGQGSNQESTLKEPDESKDLQSQPPPQPQPQPQQHLPQEQPSSPPFLQSQHQQSQQTNKEPSLPNLEQEKSVVEKTNPNPNVSQEKVCEASDMEQSDPEDDGPETSEKNIEPSKITLKENATEIINSTETNIFQKQEITELFKPTGGIPGLDLVGSKEIGSIENVEDERNNPEVIDLDKDGPTRPPKVCAPSKNNMLLFSSKVPEQAPVKILEDQGLKSQATLISSQPLKRKIPSLFDIVIEKPVLSPVNESKIASPVRNSSPVVDSRSRSISKDREALISPGQRPLSQVSATSNRQQQVQNTLDASTEQPIVSTSFNRQQSDLPPQAADLAKALQDPNVMQLLSHAIAQAQQAGVGNSSGNPQQNQLIQQLQKLRPLLQMTQNQNSNNQQWNNSQFPSQQSQNWQNQNSNNRFNMNDSNRNSFGRTPFNTNEEPLSRGFASGNDSDNSDRQQKNPRNPFRRNENRGNDNNFNNSSSEMNPDGPNAEGSFSNKNNNPFGRQLYSQPQHGNNFGRDNFDGSNLGGGNFNNRNMNVGDSYRGADFEENIANDFRGGNFGRENFQSNSFSEDNTDLGKGDFDRDNNYDGNSGGGGRFDTNRSNTNFGNSSGFRNNTNDTNNFRGGDTNDFYRPAQVFDYQNRSRSDAFIPQAKVVDYGHKPSLNMPVSSFSRDSSEFVPVKTIDYGHSSNSANKETPEAKTTKKVNRWNQEPQSNENEAHSTNIKQTQADKNQDSTKSNEEEGLSEEINEEIAKSTEEQLQYPNNKWVLQNPESRQRPGPPTKRGKRKPKTQPKHVPEEDKTECDEIEENFEEISENEDMNDSRQILSPSAKLKGKPLFPSVSDTNKNQPIVFPSMENNNTIPIDEILFQPGRLSRPKNIVIIIRGPPGSGKSHVAKLIKDKEVEMGGQTPRLLSIDDYFMVENDYEEKCSKTGRKIPKKEILYEYEKEAEPTYMQYLIKSFKKTVTDHLFDFIIVDCCNQSLRTFNEFYNAARDGNFSPFVIDLKCDLETCLNQNIHSRKEEEIKEIIKNYQDCPGHYIKLDVSNLLENVVEMEDVSDLEDNFVADSEVIELDDDDEEDEEQNDNVAGGFLKSKWDTDPTTENLARLDGTSKPISKRGTATIEEYLQIDGWEPPASNTDGKKRVRWADIEEKRAQDKMRAIGFVVGQTDWNRMMDPTSGSGALTKTKYIERYNKRR